MIPNAEKLIGNYLRSYSGLGGTRVVGQSPSDGQRSTPWIRLTELDASNDPALPPDHLITFFLQCDCYAGGTGGQPEAVALGRQTREALAALHGSGTALVDSGTLGGTAVVTSVRFASMARIPDTDGFEPARERVIIDAEVMMHGV